MRQLTNSKKDQRRIWVREIFKKREEVKTFEHLYSDLRKDREYFFRYLRMSPDRFDHLLSLVKDRIEKRNTRLRKAIPPEARLAITLRFLASGETQQSLSYSFRVGRQTLSKIVSETCEAIYEALKDPYLRLPSSSEDWKSISERFEDIWNFPHVVGAVDGKHIRIECPKLSGTLYHNYKGFFSMVRGCSRLF